MYRKTLTLVLTAMAVVVVTVPLIDADTDDKPVSFNLEDYDITLLSRDFTIDDLEIDIDSFKGRSVATALLKGCYLSPVPGEPALPVISDPLVTDVELDDIRLIRRDPVTVDLIRPIRSVQEPIPLTEENMVRWDTDPYLDYDDELVYPEKTLLWGSTGSKWTNGAPKYHYSLAASPVDYDPSSNELTLYRSIEVVGYSEERSEMRTPTRQVNPPDELVPGTELLIVCKDSYWDDLDDYVNWKRQKGVVVTLIGFSAVDSAYSGSDGASKLWRYVHDSYFGDLERLKNVLLVGEPTDSHVPSRMVKDLNPYGPAGEPSTLPSDTYFGCLGSHSSGPNIWNMDGDSNWGEVNDIGDYHPEVYVSRIAVNTDSRAKSWAQKIMEYEKNPSLNSWMGTAGLFGADTHQDTDGAVQCEYLWNKHLDTVYSKKAAYYSDGVGGSTPLNSYNAQVGINDGFGVLVYMGHGLRQYWSEGLQGQSRLLLDANDAASFSQSPEIPYITAMSCETNWFDGSYDSISEGFTENSEGGALAYAGASRTTYGGIGYNQYTPGAPGIQEDILRMISQGKRGSAEIFQEAKSTYVDNFQAYFASNPEPTFNAWMEHNLLGPAETEIWVEIPETMTATFDFDRDYYSNLTVDVRNSRGSPVSGATACFCSEGSEEIFTAQTDGQGKCTFPIIIESTSWAKITVSKSGYVPFQEEVLVEDNTDPVTEFAPDLGNPNGANDWYTQDPEIRLITSEPCNTYYSWNGGSELTYKGSINAPVGENTLQFRSVDSSGNEEKENSIVVKYDPLVPESEVQINPTEPDGNYGWYLTKPRIDVILTESRGAPQWIDYWWDRSEKQRYNGTIDAKEGDHVLHIQARDEAGNTEEEQEFILKVDSVAPTTDLLTGGVYPNEYGWYTNTFEITLRCDDQRANVRYRWDGGEWKDYSTPITPKYGNHTLEYHAEDTIGNMEEIKESVIRYDISAPKTVLETDPDKPDGTGGWFVTEPTVMLSVEGEENDYSIIYRIDNEQWQEYSFPIKIEEGEHTFSYYSQDEAGNKDRERITTFNVDTEPDESEAYADVAKQDNGFYTKNPRITLKIRGEGVIYYSWETHGSFLTYNNPIMPPASEGDFELRYYCVDPAGNTENMNKMSILVDSKPPEVACANVNSVDEGEVITFDLSNTTDGFGVDSYMILFGDGEDSGWVETPVIEHAYDSAGTYEVIIRARDEAGHVSDDEVRIIEVTEKSFLQNIMGGSDTQVVMTIAIVLGAILIVLIVVIMALIIRNNRAHHAMHHTHHLPPGHPLRAPDNEIRPSGVHHGRLPPHVNRGQKTQMGIGHPSPKSGPVQNTQLRTRPLPKGAPPAKQADGRVPTAVEGIRTTSGVKQNAERPEVPKPPKPPNIPPPPKSPF